MNEIFDYFKFKILSLEKSMFSIRKNGILSILEILYIPQNFWHWERALISLSTV